ncbi:MAG: endopeptidase La [Acutalibacteraceae bacterium]|nr:endopeptidase La [Acutalibacteraceae bacterium]
MTDFTPDNTKILPALALRGLVCFPGVMLHFDVGRKKSIKSLNAAMERGQKIFLVAQKNVYDEDPKQDDLYTIGCVARICQVLRMSDDSVKVLVEGLYRAKTMGIDDSGSFMTATVKKCEIPAVRHRQVYLETLARKIRSEFEAYASKGIKLAPDIATTVATSDDIGYLSDFIAFNIPVPVDDKQYILEQMNIVTRAKIALELLGKEAEIIDIDRRIGEKVKTQIDDNQREYYLREQIKAINFELYGDTAEDEVDEYFAKIDKLSAPEKVKEKLAGEVQKLQKMPQGSHEATVVRGYLDTCLELPWNTCTEAKLDIKKSQKILDRDFYGMEKVKERIIEQLSVYLLNPDVKGQIICLAGPPGVGKTSIGKAIAECMGRNYARISLGGIHDEAEIRGHRKTYIGAMPGKIISAIKQAGSSNPLILLDEIDKLASDYKGDPSAALLEVLDKEQNSTFTDHFIDMPYDLGKVVFITTANDTSTIPAPLLDRMEVIELTSYTREEKFNIAKKHLVKKEIKNHGLDGKKVKITDAAVYDLIDFYTREAGVRKLERTIATLCRKTAKAIASGETANKTITSATVSEMLGKRKYRPEEILSCDEVGIINGLAWTSVGGELMQLEVSVMEGTGKIELTGSLGDVMKESARAAVSFVRSNAAKYGIDADFYKNKDIHIHATENAVPKDGPSAGVTITTALVSALTNTPVRRDVAMTGEVTIKGRVLAIGGLKEKTMAAYRAGVKTVFIPKANEADLAELDKTVLANVDFVVAEKVETVIDGALLFPFKKEENFIPVPEYKTAGRISQ